MSLNYVRNERSLPRPTKSDAIQKVFLFKVINLAMALANLYASTQAHIFGTGAMSGEKENNNKKAPGMFSTRRKAFSARLLSGT